jgi:hypothetical protein
MSAAAEPIVPARHCLFSSPDRKKKKPPEGGL